MHNHYLFTFLSLFLWINTAYSQQNIKVRNLEQFNEAVKKVRPGDKVILANGVWKDAELVFVGKGTAKAPITLTVENKGKVSLEGQSNLRIAGEYLVVEGLVFKNGYTPTSAVIEFRRNKTHLANHCRVTECVIDNYSNPERFETDYWVSIYGKNNRFDHNFLTGKRNHGVTLAVRLNTVESRENKHQIDHNYFGHRPILGANGGETMRVGTSHYSLTNSNTIVEANYFDRCNGEHEIISNKSGQNIFRYNTFFECQGTLTMRHGNETLVESNYFFGNHKPNTGGIRIINEKQTVINNYCEGLTGYRFRGALVIMNGVPNSPLNRYFQVKDSKAINNSFINCDYVQLCAGSDAERSAVPVNTVVSNNIFYNEKNANLFTVYDDIKGIAFNKNVLSKNIQPIHTTGFTQRKISFKRNKEGILIPQGKSLRKLGFQSAKSRATPENTGVNWYPRREEEVRFGYGKTTLVKPGENTLFDALKESKAGDILVLVAGNYTLTKPLIVKHPITITSKSTSTKPLIQFQRTSLFNIENGGSLSLGNLHISGKECPDAAGNTVIRTSRYSMNRNYKLFVQNCDFTDLDINHSFNVLTVFKNTFADSILVRKSTFKNVSGAVLELDKETDDRGIYNVENVLLEDCTFSAVKGAVLNVYRGGSDESTFGPMVTVRKCVFENTGRGKRNKIKSSLAFHGAQVIEVKQCEFKKSAPIKLHLVVGDPIVNISNCQFFKTPKIISNDPAYKTKNLTFK